MTTSLTVNSLIDHLKDDHDMTMAAINEWVREQKHALLTDDTWLTLLMRLHTGLPTVNNCLTWGEDKMDENLKDELVRMVDVTLMDESIKDELLRMVVVTYSRYCDIGPYRGKHFIKLEGYVSNELLQFLNSLPPIERDPPIEIDMRSKYPDT